MFTFGQPKKVESEISAKEEDNKKEDDDEESCPEQAESPTIVKAQNENKLF